MRHYKAIFQLLARSSIYRLLLLFLLMTAVQGGLFYYVLTGQLALGTPGIEAAVDQSRLSWVFGIGALLAFIILAASGCELGSRQSYTLKRLPISEKAVFVCQSVYNALGFFLFWAVELLITYLLCRLYVFMADPCLLSGQTVMLAYYRSDLLHALLPLADTYLWVRNVLLVLSLGIITASISYHQRRGAGLFEGDKWTSVIPVSYLVLTTRGFSVPSYPALIFTCALFVYALVVTGFILLRRREVDAS